MTRFIIATLALLLAIPAQAEDCRQQWKHSEFWTHVFCDHPIPERPIPDVSSLPKIDRGLPPATVIIVQQPAVQPVEPYQTPVNNRPPISLYDPGVELRNIDIDLNRLDYTIRNHLDTTQCHDYVSGCRN